MHSSWPYLAGFFDGDGSLHFQIVRQKHYRFGFYIRVSLVLYQATVAEDGLLVLRDLLGCGRLRRRTVMSDLTITNRQQIQWILSGIHPYAIFKRRQVEAGLRLLERLPPPREPLGFLEVCQHVDEFASLNFSKNRSVTATTVARALEEMGVLVPVTTDSKEETEASRTHLTSPVIRQPPERG